MMVFYQIEKANTYTIRLNHSPKRGILKSGTFLA